MDNFDFLLAAGGEESDRGSLADFAAVKSMKRQISNQFRSEYNGSTLFSVGLEIDSKGNMLLNGSRFDQTYDQTPEIFDSIIKADNGLLDQVDEIVGSFNGITGSVQTKLDYTQQQLDLIDQKLVNLDNQYERQFQRYLQQFTSLNAVIDQMNSTSGLFAF
jgi:flagellar hook-associated protein 2